MCGIELRLNVFGKTSYNALTSPHNSLKFFYVQVFHELGFQFFKFVAYRGVVAFVVEFEYEAADQFGKFGTGMCSGSRMA